MARALPLLLLCPQQSLCPGAAPPQCRAANHPALRCRLSSGGMDPDLSPAWPCRGGWAGATRVLAAPGKQGGGRRSSAVGKEQVSPLRFVKLLILGREGPASSALPARVPSPPPGNPLLLGGQCHWGCRLLQGVTVFQAQVTDIRRLKLISLLLQFLFLLLLHFVLLLLFRPIQ